MSQSMRLYALRKELVLEMAELFLLLIERGYNTDQKLNEILAHILELLDQVFEIATNGMADDRLVP